MVLGIVINTEDFNDLNEEYDTDDDSVSSAIHGLYNDVLFHHSTVPSDLPSSKKQVLMQKSESFASAVSVDIDSASCSTSHLQKISVSQEIDLFVPSHLPRTLVPILCIDDESCTSSMLMEDSVEDGLLALSRNKKRKMPSDLWTISYLSKESTPGEIDSFAPSYLPRMEIDPSPLAIHMDDESYTSSMLLSTDPTNTDDLSYVRDDLSFMTEDFVPSSKKTERKIISSLRTIVSQSSIHWDTPSVDSPKFDEKSLNSDIIVF